MDKTRRIAVIGGGVSGLSCAWLLKQKGHEAVVFEATDRIGGLVKCDIIDGMVFHRTGGHVFNTKSKTASEFFWSLFDRDSQFVKADRNSGIILGEHTVGYPIENHIYELPEEVRGRVVDDLLSIAKDTGTGVPSDFADFLKRRFGQTLFDIYFKPYNTKVWRCDLADIPLSWLDGKLPMPTIREILLNNIDRVEEKKFVHSTFFYPRSGGSQMIPDRLARDLDVRLNTPVKTILNKAGRWLIDGAPFDAVVFTGNIRELPALLGSLPEISPFVDDIDRLKSHGTTTVFCTIDANPYTWLYLPDSCYDAHRIICTGNFTGDFSGSNRIPATVEFTDSIDRSLIADNLRRMPFAPRRIADNYAPYTYPIQTYGTRSMVDALKRALAARGLYLLGRFAEWEYYNMDAAMDAALRLVGHITSANED